MRVCALVLISCVVFSLCHPIRPLNERSPELAWQAWLLVDDQNQGGRHGNTAEAALKRRITPKSVFIAPTFSPQDLPPCAEGYASDPMGRCMKIFKLDEDEHLNFLLDKLKEKFGGADLDYGEEDEDADSDSPLQINIPLNSDDIKTSNSDEETDMAIVVAPTNSNFTVQEFILNSSHHVDVQTSSSDVNVRISSATDSYVSTEETTTEISTIPTTVTEETTTETEAITSTTTTTTDDTTTTSTEPITTETTTLRALQTTRQTRVRFPDDSALPEIGHTQTRDTSNRVRNFWPNFSNGPAKQQQVIRFPEDRNKISFGGAENLQKPLVLRFSKKNSYVDANQFKRPDFYRALPPNELSYIFGFKHRTTN